MLPNIQKKLPLRVAILPFENISEAPQAAELVRRSFFNQFSSKKFKDVEMYQVNERLRQKGWKRVGDSICVTLTGKPGMVVTFDMGLSIKGIPMSEQEPGIYHGCYKVMPGDFMSGGMVVGHLVDTSGNQSNYVDPLGLVHVDTIPPAIPLDLKAKQGNGAVALTWSHVADVDVAMYEVLRSDSPKSGYQQIGQSQTTLFVDEPPEKNKDYYYRVVVRDSAGNKSKETPFQSARSLNPGPTYVSGDIDLDTMWYAGSSPYMEILQMTVILI